MMATTTKRTAQKKASPKAKARSTKPAAKTVKSLKPAGTQHAVAKTNPTKSSPLPAADLRKLRDVATKLEQLADIVSRSQFVTGHEKAEQLYGEFWDIVDDLKSLEKQTLAPVSHGWQTTPDVIHEHVRALTGFTNGVVTIADGPDQKRSPFFSPRGRIPLWETSKVPFAAIADQLEKVDEQRRQDWKTLCRQIETLVSEQRCRDACDAIRLFEVTSSSDPTPMGGSQAGQKADVIHDATESPPADYREHGPFVGTKILIGCVLRPGDYRDMKNDGTFRDQFNDSIEAGTIWVRHSDTKGLFEAYFKEKSGFDRAKRDRPIAEQIIAKLATVRRSAAAGGSWFPLEAQFADGRDSYSRCLCDSAVAENYDHGKRIVALKT